VDILLANPRGFCAGVTRAITIVEHALKKYGAPIYVRHEVVHNRFVCDALRAQGAVFIDQLSEAPEGSVLVFSAHGVSRAVREKAAARKFRVLDATCPLVTKVHSEVGKMRGQGREVVMIGHRGHPEVEGTMGQSETGIYLVEKAADVETLRIADAERLSFVTQTTLSIDEARETVAALRRRFPSIVGPAKNDICYATQNRQDAVKELTARCDVVIVVGSPKSSNSRRLREVAASIRREAYLVDCADELNPSWFLGARRVGVTAGASAPEALVARVIERMKEIARPETVAIEELSGAEERITFALPRELQEE
jgi:4-hydroxy-3-methylbut-2-enyl diphosphate reductase